MRGEYCAAETKYERRCQAQGNHVNNKKRRGAPGVVHAFGVHDEYVLRGVEQADTDPDRGDPAAIATSGVVRRCP